MITIRITTIFETMLIFCDQQEYDINCNEPGIKYLKSKIPMMVKNGDVDECILVKVPSRYYNKAKKILSNDRYTYNTSYRQSNNWHGSIKLWGATPYANNRN